MGCVRPDLDRRGREHRDPGRIDRRLILGDDATHRSGETGSGLLGTAAGLLVFLLLMVAAVQILFNLYATSMITTAAHDSARRVAGFDNVADRCAAIGEADAELTAALGSYARIAEMQVDWTCTEPDQVSVHVSSTHPGILPRLLTGLAGLGRFDRTIVVRAESVR